MAKNKCAVLMTTCDGYEDAWYPFFRLFEINWPDCKYPLFMNTESKSYVYDGLEVKCLHPQSTTDKKGKPISWSNRLKQAVEKIDADYILFMLEDFFIKSPVRTDMVEECIKWMDEEDDVVFIDFYRDNTENDIIFRKEFSQIERNNDWAINANCALWRRGFLLDILRDENPWDFEMNATARWRRTKYKIYTHRAEFAPVFDYQFTTVNGEWSAILKGKWLVFVPELFEKYGIEVDFEKRGLIDPPDMRPREREKNWLLHDIFRSLKSPKMLWHYIVCTKNVAKDKLVRFWRKYFNR